MLAALGNQLVEQRLQVRAHAVQLADDRRTVRIGITERGLALLAELAGGVRICHTRQLGHLVPGELRTLIDLLRKARQPHEPPGSEWR